VARALLLVTRGGGTILPSFALSSTPDRCLADEYARLTRGVRVDYVGGAANEERTSCHRDREIRGTLHGFAGVRRQGFCKQANDWGDEVGDGRATERDVSLRLQSWLLAALVPEAKMTGYREKFV
jgi:hypothetical protein